ncbi:MAG: mechanosensitive ion channel family protein [Erysipelotrichaceae bacterium]|nr:mechanosensitive ion channel family protein [Erysipelotrichaceae bacterium]
MKKFLGLIVCVVLLIVIGAAGKLTGTTENLLALNLHLDSGAVLSAISSVLILLIVQQVITLILKSLNPKSHRARTGITVAGSVLKYVVAIVALCAVLSAFGADVRTVVAGIGVLALIIGFGAESLIEDMVTGLFAIMDNQYNVGDIIEVNGFRGTVSDIGIRTTSLTDAGGNVLIVNNSNMKNILNRSNNASRAVSEIDIPYETDVEEFEKLLPAMMDEIYAAHTDKMKSVPVYLGIGELGESGIRLKFCVEVEEKNIYGVQRILNRELLVAFRKAGVEVPFPQVDVHQR